MPIFWYWLLRVVYPRRGLYPLGTRTRLESARRQNWRWIKVCLPAWGLGLAGAIEQAVDLYHVSGKVRLFWDVFVTASALLLIGFLIVSLVALRRDEREKRRQQAGSSLTQGES